MSIKTNSTQEVKKLGVSQAPPNSLVTLLHGGSNLKSPCGGFPGGAVVENMPANAGDMGSSPGPEISCVPQLLSLCSRAREPRLLSPCAATTEARVPRAHAPRQEKSPQ